MSTWKTGPLPSDTWNWGGVVVKGEDSAHGFRFADFCGDHVLLCPSGKRIEAADVALYNNCLELPPNVTKRAGGS